MKHRKSSLTCTSGRGKKRGPHPADIAAGAFLRQIRTAAGMSQTALGKGSDLTFQQVQKYERGSNRMSISRFIEFCITAGINPVTFFAGLPKSILKGLPRAEADAKRIAKSGPKRVDYEMIRNIAQIPDGPFKRQLLKLVKTAARAGAVSASGLTASGSSRTRPSKVTLSARLGRRDGTQRRTSTGTVLRSVASGGRR